MRETVILPAGPSGSQYVTAPGCAMNAVSFTLTESIVLVPATDIESNLPESECTLKEAVASRNGSIKDGHILALAWVVDADIWSSDRDFRRRHLVDAESDARLGGGIEFGGGHSGTYFSMSGVASQADVPGRSSTPGLRHFRSFQACRSTRSDLFQKMVRWPVGDLPIDEAP